MDSGLMGEIDLSSAQFDTPHPAGGTIIDLNSAQFDNPKGGDLSPAGHDASLPSWGAEKVIPKIGSAINDAATSVIGYGLSKIAPDATMAAAKGINYIADSAPVQAIEKGISSAGNAINKFGEDHPVAGTIMDSLKDTSKVAGAVIPAAGEMEAAGTEAAKTLADAAARPAASRLENVGSDQHFLNAINIVKKNYGDVLKNEDDLWDKSRASGTGATISGAAMEGIPSKVEAALNKGGKSLSDDDLKPLADQIRKFGAFKGESVGVDASGDMPKITPGKDAELSAVVALRHGVSGLAASSDGTVRNAAGVALRQINDHLAGIGEDAITGGSDTALQDFKAANDATAQKFRDYGTNSKSGQTKSFENVITKDDFDDAKALKEFGSTTRGNQGTSQLITRMIENAGADKEAVRSSIARGYAERAIEKSLMTGEGGDISAMPGRLRVELTRLISGGVADGGMEAGLRKVVFTPEELQGLTKMRDKIKDPKSWLGAVRMLGVKIPLMATAIDKPSISAGKKTAKLVGKYLAERDKP